MIKNILITIVWLIVLIGGAGTIGYLIGKLLNDLPSIFTMILAMIGGGAWGIFISKISRKYTLPKIKHTEIDNDDDWEQV